MCKNWENSMENVKEQGVQVIQNILLNVEHQYTRPYVTSFSLTFSNEHYKV